MNFELSYQFQTIFVKFSNYVLRTLFKSSSLIFSDELEVHREEDVFNAVIKWTECKADTW